jgi:hypothetical protein
MNQVVLGTASDVICTGLMIHWIFEEFQKSPGWKRNFFVAVYAAGLMASVVAFGIRLFS